jgi:hypothetical protein
MAMTLAIGRPSYYSIELIDKDLFYNEVNEKIYNAVGGSHIVADNPDNILQRFLNYIAILSGGWQE